MALDAPSYELPVHAWLLYMLYASRLLWSRQVSAVEAPSHLVGYRTAPSVFDKIGNSKCTMGQKVIILRSQMSGFDIFIVTRCFSMDLILTYCQISLFKLVWIHPGGSLPLGKTKIIFSQYLSLITLHTSLVRQTPRWNLPLAKQKIFFSQSPATITHQHTRTTCVSPSTSLTPRRLSSAPQSTCAATHAALDAAERARAGVATAAGAAARAPMARLRRG